MRFSEVSSSTIQAGTNAIFIYSGTASLSFETPSIWFELFVVKFAVELDWIRELDGELVRIRLPRGRDQERIAGEWLCTSRGAVRLSNFAHTTQKGL